MARAQATRPKQLRLTADRIVAPVVREPILHRQIADALRYEIGAPGKVSPEGVTWYSVDMAAYAGKVPGLRTGRGCIAGVADINVIYKGMGHFIELKALDGRLSPAQCEMATTYYLVGARFGVARDIDETLELLDTWGIPRAYRVRGRCDSAQPRGMHRGRP